MKPIFTSLPLAIATALSIVGITHQAQAVTMNFSANNSGNYNQNGTTFTQASATSYLTGRVTNPQENRSYFVFTIPSNFSATNRTILSASLILVNPGTGANANNRTLNITNVTSSIANVINGASLTNAQRQAIFNDLGTGGGNLVYGSTSLTTGIGSPVTVNLNQNNVLTAIRNAAGGQFAVGGAVTGLNTANNQSIFVGSGASPATNRQLSITFADAILSTNGDQQFGPVLIGQSANRTLTITNTGEAGSTLSGSIGASGTPTITPTGGTVNFSLGATQQASRTFAYTPTVRGSNSTTVSVTSNNTNPSLLLTGSGVAPQNAVTATDLNAGFVRIGTSETVGVTIQNIGDGNLSGQGAVSNLNGTASLTGSSPNFMPTTGSVGAVSLTDNTAQNFNFLYTPTASGAESQVLTLNFSNGSDNGTNQAQTRTFTLTGVGVGPAFQSGPLPGSTLDFGEVQRNRTEMLELMITNATQDPTAVDSLTGLTLIDAFFEGPDAEFFSLVNFVPGTVLSRGESLALDILFSSNETGSKNAILRILTDQGTDFGQAGVTFSYNLSATAVPEPSSLVGLGTFAAVILLGKRKRNAD